MSFDGIKVEHGKLTEGSANVIAGANEIRSRLDQLVDDLKPLSTDWTGAAKEAYAEAKATWDRAIDEMVVLLKQAGENVETSNDEYKSADQRGAGRF